MRYSNIIVAGSTVIIKTFLTGHQIFITNIDISIELIAFAVNGPSLQTITAVRIIISCDTQIQIIAYGQVITSILNKVTSPWIVTKCREQYPRDPSRSEGEIGKGQCD